MSTDLLSIARSIALEAAELAAARRAASVSVVAAKSSIVDVVTQADRDTERLIRDRLVELRPNDGFFGEESGAEAGSSGLTWLVDPIDGTVNYLFGLPNYAVSIAVVEGEPDPLSWRALAACVVNPATGDVYTATDAGGAFQGDRRLHIGPAPSLAEALLGTGFGYASELRLRQGAAVGALLGETRDIRRMGSAALDLCAVAAGTLTGYFESGTSPWDHAAGALIAREAGAIVKGWSDDAPGRDLVLAGPPGLVGELEAALRRHGY